MKLLKLLFPYYFNNKIQLTGDQIQEMEMDDDDLCGSELVVIEYLYKCNRHIGMDMFIQTVSILIILGFIIFLILYI